ncbi:16682_t:CDS:2 [Gigaspora margarita]|uniref:16682_t:CDS:1 n=1 Tax=Gigaspora margarita TaxID=4874 RepID=A0ABN7V284_GIGMA|nr:16682_t:CDS:2 [Gigaspora margarita]
MSANIFSYKSGEIGVFDTGHDNVQVKVEELNEDVARATKNEITLVEVKSQKSYLITWINSYELRIDNEKFLNLKHRKGMCK